MEREHDHEHGHGHDHEGHDHEARDRGAHNHGENARGPGEDAPDMSAWIASADTGTCPACGASGALSLGGGLFCPACGQVTTNPGYQPPPE